MHHWRALLCVGGIGLLWVLGAGGDVRAGDADVIGMLRRLQSRFVTLDTRFLETARLVAAAKQQVDAAKQQADAAKQLSERALQEAALARQQAAHETALARQQAETAKQAAEASQEKVAQAAKQIKQAEQSAQIARQEAAKQIKQAEQSAQIARQEATAAKQTAASFEHRLQQQALAIRTLQRQLEQQAPKIEALSAQAGQPKRFMVDDVAFVVRWIPRGTFWMGSPENEPYRDGDEGLQRKVRIRQGYWMMESEVTQRLYKAVTGTHPSHFSSCGPNCPVESVSWHQAALFANQLSEKMRLPKCFVCGGENDALRCDGIGNKNSDYLGCKGWRLPTEAEWEYAARAGTTSPFHTGPCLSTNQANYNGIALTNCPTGNNRKKTIEVCSLARNNWGLCDVHGNVYEWVYDGYEAAAYRLLKEEDPIYTKKTLFRAMRGGGWQNYAQTSRAAFRHRTAATDRYTDLGFRLVKR